MVKVLSAVWNIIERVTCWGLSLIEKLFRIEITGEKKESFLQFIKFGLVGVSNTLLSYVINVLVLLALENRGVSWDYIAGNTLAFIISVAWSFYWNNKYVFMLEDGQQRNLVLALLKTYISYAFTGIILANLLSYIWIYLLGVSKYVAPLVNLIISVPLNFIINKFWAFKNK